MKSLTYFLTLIFLACFIGDFFVNDRANRVVKGESLLVVGLFVGSLFALLVVSVRHFKQPFGKIGLLSILLAFVIHFFNQIR